MGGWQGMGLDDTFPIRKAIPVGLARALFFFKKNSILYFLHTHHTLINR